MVELYSCGLAGDSNRTQEMFVPHGDSSLSLNSSQSKQFLLLQLAEFDSLEPHYTTLCAPLNTYLFGDTMDNDTPVETSWSLPSNVASHDASLHDLLLHSDVSRLDDLGASDHIQVLLLFLANAHVDFLLCLLQL